MQPWSSSRGLWLAIGLLLDLSLHGQTAGGVQSAIRFDHGAATNPIVITWPEARFSFLGFRPVLAQP